MAKLLHSDRFRQIARLVHVATATDGDIVSEQLQGDDFDQRGKQFENRWDVNNVLDEAADPAVAFCSHGNDTTGASSHFLDVG